MTVEPYTFDTAAMTLNQYQQQAYATNKNTLVWVQVTDGSEQDNDIVVLNNGPLPDMRLRPILGVYNSLGLAGETGEFVEKMKKRIRDGTFDREATAKELGDVLWYLSQLAKDLDYTLEDIAKMNLKKLADRRARNKIHGSGDER
jgi:NTP pyrophosphatase (non-canonical NTP hydrolase)